MNKREEKADQEIRDLFDSACYEARKELIFRARKVLRQHPNAVEFVMGMGTVFFVMKDDSMVGLEGTKTLDMERAKAPAYMKPVFDLILAWDDAMKLTGDPMRFTVDGPVITQW